MDISPGLFGLLQLCCQRVHGRGDSQTSQVRQYYEKRGEKGKKKREREKGCETEIAGEKSKQGKRKEENLYPWYQCVVEETVSELQTYFGGVRFQAFLLCIQESTNGRGYGHRKSAKLSKFRKKVLKLIFGEGLG